MLYHPDGIRIIDYFQNVLFIITSFLTGFTLYAIYNKSPKTMGMYKYVLLNASCWTYIGEVVLFLWRPVNVFPYFVFYSGGVFKYLPNDMFMFYIFLQLFTLLGLENAFGLAYVFRISQVFFASWFHEFVNNRRNLVILFFGLFAFELLFLGGKSWENSGWCRRFSLLFGFKYLDFSYGVDSLSLCSHFSRGS